MKIAVTGANSSVGQSLLKRLTKEVGTTIWAGVRSEKAFSSLPQDEAIKPVVISYDDVSSLEKIMAEADCVIHLAGILVETKNSNYASANIAATAAIVDAALTSRIKHLIFISVIGADPDSNNAYFRSKGVAEELISNSGINASLLRTPILLGPGAAGSQAILGMASSGQTKVLGGGNYQMRPLDIDDLAEALTKLSQTAPAGAVVHELVGPASFSYRDIISKTAELMGKSVEIGSVPIWIAKIGSAITSTLKGGGITPTVIDVITQDEVIDTNADKEIGITLTSLEGTLQKMVNTGD